jgi:hypothetical protein
MKLFGVPKQFWVVTKPTAHSTLGDICFETNFSGLMQMARGGFREENVVAIFKDRKEAEIEALSRMLAFVSSKKRQHGDK